MAIYHCHVRVGSRSRGASARAKAQYVLRQDRYSRLGTAVTGHAHMPAWAREDPVAYWVAADLYERKNATLYREIEVALPRELDLEQCAELVREFAKTVTAEGLPHVWAIHDDGHHNPHAHIVLSERVVDGHDRTPETWFRRAATSGRPPESGGARKAGLGEERMWLQNLREAWAQACNAALARHGHRARVDHRSYAAQGVDRTPQVHLGPRVLGRMVRRARAAGEEAAEAECDRYRLALAVADTQELEAKVEWLRREVEQMQWDRTRASVERQLRGMGCRHYDIGIYHPDRGMIIQSTLTPQDVLRRLKYYAARNTQGENIYIRPAAREDGQVEPLVLVDDVTSEAIDRMRADGLEPAVVVETSPANYQVWVRLADHTIPMSSDARTAAGRLLAERYHGDPAAIDFKRWGRLSGFTNRKIEHLAKNGQYPYVRLHSYRGKIASRGPEILRSHLLQPKQLRPKPKKPQQVDSKNLITMEYYMQCCEQYMQCLQEQKYEALGAGLRIDNSVIDWRVAKRMLDYGVPPGVIATVMRETSPGLGVIRHQNKEDYVVRTVAKAIVALRDIDSDNLRVERRSVLDRAKEDGVIDQVLDDMRAVQRQIEELRGEKLQQTKTNIQRGLGNKKMKM